MDTPMWIGLAVVGLVLIGAVAWYVNGQQRSRRLRGEFGPEYHTAVAESGNPRRAEAELEARRKRVDALHILPLSREDAAAFEARWLDVQREFVDEPSRAIARADELVREVMQQRGYPVGDFEQRAADLSVDHPNVVSRYRAAREISDRNARSEADTEDLRRALLHFRALFSELLDSRDPHDDAPDRNAGRNDRIDRERNPRDERTGSPTQHRRSRRRS
jgi:hypothetical protein